MVIYLIDSNDAEHYINMIVHHAVPCTLLLKEITKASSSNIQLEQDQNSISSSIKVLGTKLRIEKWALKLQPYGFTL